MTESYLIGRWRTETEPAQGYNEFFGSPILMTAKTDVRPRDRLHCELAFEDHVARLQLQIDFCKAHFHMKEDSLL